MSTEPLMKFVGADTYDLASPYCTVIDHVRLNGEPDKRPWVELNFKEGWGEHIDDAKGYDHDNGRWHTIRVEGDFAAIIQKRQVLEEDLGMFEDV